MLSNSLAMRPSATASTGVTAQPGAAGVATQSGGVPPSSVTALRIACRPAGSGSSTRTLKPSVTSPGVPPLAAGTVMLASQALPAAAPTAPSGTGPAVAWSVGALWRIVARQSRVTVGEGNNQKNRVQEVSEITGGLKALAKELSVPIIALSQLSRQVEQREDEGPQLSELRESGSVGRDTQCVMFVYRESYYLGRA